MRVLFTRDAWSDNLVRQELSRETAGRINRLINDILRSPFIGLGKPKPLRGDHAGWWSRRIASDHRLVYRVIGTRDDQRIEIMSCRFHYNRRS